jgi:DMSO/TMAO reductase YedYZ molybdopterin-dependent catalytic subunit
VGVEQLVQAGASDDPDHAAIVRARDFENVSQASAYSRCDEARLAVTRILIVAPRRPGDLPAALLDAARETVLAAASAVPGADPTVVEQRSLAAVIAAADGPVLAIDGGAPEATAAILAGLAEQLGRPGVDALVGHALNGGRPWALGLARPRALSIPDLADDGSTIERELRAQGLRVARVVSLRSVRTLDDASAALDDAPQTPFAVRARALSVPHRERPAVPVVRATLGDLFEGFERYRLGPLREGWFGSRLHTERTAALLGMALGIAFTVCFLTGLYSHVAEFGPGWAQRFVPAGPTWLFRVTQGIHIVTGMLAVPLLLAKLWTVYPKLWEWPPVRNSLHAIERLSLVALVGGATFQLVTGLLNIFYWYAFPFNFVPAHWAGAWVAIGGLIVHIGAKWEVARRALRRPQAETARRPAIPGLSRRGFIGVAGATSAVIVATTVGSTTGRLSWAAILAPRRAGVGPQGVPTNHLANSQISAAALAADYTLEIVGKVRTPLQLSLADLRAEQLAEEDLPISCVEGWSTSARWRGIRVRDLLDRAGAAHDAHVRVESLQSSGGYRSSVLRPNFTRDGRTLLALELNGEQLHLDHGYPVRLIAPNRPGVHQTKWVSRLVVL